MNFTLKNIAIGFVSILLVACEIIPEGERLLPIELEKSNRTTLLVEFSGLKCNNCPLAAEEAHNLLSLYGDKLVVVEMHPASNPLTAAKAEYDYTCAASDFYYNYFGGNNTTPLPVGVVNMSKTNDVFFVKYQEWGAAYSIAAKMASPVAITPKINTKENQLHIEATIDNLSANALDIQYIAWLTEDNIVGLQMMPDGKPVSDYVHNHILRGAITEEWGTAVQIDGNASTTLTLTYTIPENVKTENCNVVSIIMKDNMAIQANEYKLKK